MGLLFGRVSDETRKIELGGRNDKFTGNKIDSSKYNLVTFLPKSLILQFTRLSNLVFLINAVLQSIPILSSVSPFTALGPLAFVLAISMLREGYEDYVVHHLSRKDTRKIGKSIRERLTSSETVNLWRQNGIS
jgi:hypothetical protein